MSNFVILGLVEVRRCGRARNPFGNELTQKNLETCNIASFRTCPTPKKQNPTPKGIPLRVRDLEKQIGSDGATWFDRRLAWPETSDLASSGFGQQVREAIDQRR